jgi:hypothetical protein
LEVPKFNQHIFFASVQLASLSGALELASKCVAKELAAIDECLEDGTAPEDFDYESAADDPIALSQLTSRAVAYELVAIVEDRLNALAEVPWKASRADSVPAAPLFSNEWAEALAKEKPVSKESFKKRRTLVETHYGFDFKNLDGWQEHDELRTYYSKFAQASKGQSRMERCSWYARLEKEEPSGARGYGRGEGQTSN